MRFLKVFLPLMLLFSTGCSLLPEQIDETKNWSANKFYSEAKHSLNQGDYEGAIRYYEMLEARYPFGRYAQQAQLEVAYAYYKYNEPDSAIAAADRFIKMHPQHPHVDYAYYLKGLVNFNRGRDLMEKLLPQDSSEHDQHAARQAFHDFKALISKFPESRYAEDARQRMLFLRNNLARYEVNVAEFYMRRQAYVAAANRAKYVIENYQHTPAVIDAVAIMSDAYRMMGMPELADDARRVLELNAPAHPANAGTTVN
jgi:outer membrane protein assembly factor BamD